MKIAFVSDAVFPWHVGGMEQTERHEAEALAEKHEVHFFCFRWGSMKAEFTDKGIRYHARHYLTDRQFYRHRRRSIREAFYLSLIAWRIFSDKFDVVKANTFPYLHLPVVKLYCRLHGARLIMDVAEVWSKERWVGYLGPIIGTLMWRYTNWTLSGADAYVVSAGDASCDGLSAIGVRRSRIYQFAPVIDDKELSGIEAQQRHGLAFYSGRLIKEKRLDSWVDVVGDAHKKYPKSRGLIVGDGPEKDSILRRISVLRLGDVISLRNYYRSRPEMHRVLKGASLFLLMSEREGLGITALESLALGTPVVLPDYTPVPKAVKDMCVVGSSEELPEIIAKILASKDKSRFIRNRRNLDNFLTSQIPQFYDRLFRKI